LIQENIHKIKERSFPRRSSVDDIRRLKGSVSLKGQKKRICRRCGEIYFKRNNLNCRYHDGDYFSDKEGDQNQEIFETLKWQCCGAFYYKLKAGHNRESNDDLQVDDSNKFIPDQSTGCKNKKKHER